jgi:hypothetical protein
MISIPFLCKGEFEKLKTVLVASQMVTKEISFQLTSIITITTWKKCDTNTLTSLHFYGRKNINKKNGTTQYLVR